MIKNNDELFEKICFIFANVIGCETTELVDKGDIPLGRLGIKSLKIVQLIPVLEDSVKIKLNDNDLEFENFASINAIYSLFKALKKDASNELQ